MAIDFLIAPSDVELIGAKALSAIATTFTSRIKAKLVEVEIDLIPAEEMRNLNLLHRSVDSTTDVLSFPLQETLEGLSDEMPLLLGSIVICAEEATLRGETLPQLVVHGTLHLLGSDHESNIKDWLEIELHVLQELSIQGYNLQGIENW